jgi:hypothetical protein
VKGYRLILAGFLFSATWAIALGAVWFLYSAGAFQRSTDAAPAPRSETMFR